MVLLIRCVVVVAIVFCYFFPCASSVSLYKIFLIHNVIYNFYKNVYTYKKGDNVDFQKKLKIIFSIKEINNKNIDSTENTIIKQWKELVENC